MMRRRENDFHAGPPAQTCRTISRLRGGLVLPGILAPLAFLWGCGGVVSGQSTQITPPPPPQTYSISGTISPAAGGSGATVQPAERGNPQTTPTAQEISLLVVWPTERTQLLLAMRVTPSPPVA